MIPKEFDSITKEDIQALISNEVTEGRTTEYKQQLPGGSDGDKKEFLADVSSFANAGGGDLIFGISEKRDDNGKTNGIPDAADGLANINADMEKRRFEDMLRTGIDPRIPGIMIKSIVGFKSGPVLIIRIPKSWASPHMVIFSGQSRFYSRTSAGKHPLDVREIRTAFLASDSISNKMTDFRSERIARIMANETPLPLKPQPRVILHLLPVSAFSEARTVDLKNVQILSNEHLKPMGFPPSHGSTFNFDGFLAYEKSRESMCSSYVQLFRIGTIEAVWTDFIIENCLYVMEFENEILKSANQYVKFLNKLSIELPVFVVISLIGVKGCRVIWNGSTSSHKPIDRDVLLLPETLFESDTNLGELLRPMFDTIWQAAGLPGRR